MATVRYFKDNDVDLLYLEVNSATIGFHLNSNLKSSQSAKNKRRCIIRFFSLYVFSTTYV